jgi:hypothetical protein
VVEVSCRKGGGGEKKNGTVALLGVRAKSRDFRGEKKIERIESFYLAPPLNVDKAKTIIVDFLKA